MRVTKRDGRTEELNVVHQNNMTKLGPDGKPIVVNGKICKPEGYIKVSLDKFFTVKQG